MFAGEVISCLSPTAHNALRQQLEANLEAIQESFDDYLDCIQQSFIAKNKKLDRLKTYLKNFPYRSEDWKLMIFPVKKEVLKQAANVYQVFMILSGFTSFLNYHIFEKVVSQFNLDDGQEELKYPGKLRKFIEMHKISEFIEVHPVLNRYIDDTKKLVLILDISLTSMFSKLVDIGRSVAHLMELDESALLIHNIREQCVVVTFLIPNFAANRIFTGQRCYIFSIDQQEKFRHLSVQQLHCNGYVFDFTSGECSA